MDRSTYKGTTMVKIFKELSFSNANTKVNGDAVELLREYFRLFVVEAIHRSSDVAKAAGDRTIEPAHVQKVLPQLELDF